MRSTALSAAALGALVVVLAGCGGGGHKASTTTTSSSTTTAAAKTTATKGTDPNDVKKEAALLKEFASKTPSEIRPDFETVAADYSKIAEALQGVNLKQGSVPNPAALLKLEKLATSIDTQALAKASANIGAWAQKNCTP